VNRYLIDTNVVSEFSKPSPSVEVQKWLQSINSERLFVSAITVGEIRIGIENLPTSKRRTALEIWFEVGLPAWFASNLLSVTPAVADRWGRLTIQAKRKGISVATADGLIAATALEHNLVLATRNGRDFKDIGIPLFDPWLRQP